MFSRRKKDDVERSSGSEGSSEPKAGDLRHENTGDELEVIHTGERVGTHENYYEKNGLRTEGDGVDHLGVHHKVSSAMRIVRPFANAAQPRLDELQAFHSLDRPILSLDRLADSPLPRRYSPS